MPYQANGMDIVASSQAVKHAREWAISGKGPLLLEFVTYRYGGHSYVYHLLDVSPVHPFPVNLQYVRPRNHVPYPRGGPAHA